MSYDLSQCLVPMLEIYCTTVYSCIIVIQFPKCKWNEYCQSSIVFFNLDHFAD